jgi:hypothetical protein
MKTRRMKSLVRFTLTLTLLCAAAGATFAAEDPGWPREIDVQGNRLVVYQPQIDSWENYSKLRARLAVELTRKGADKPILGAIWLEAETSASMDKRLVALDNIRVAKTNFPTLDRQQSKRIAEVVGRMVPKSLPDVSLDRILAGIERTREADRAFQGSTAPPVICASTKPAILVQFDGEPVLYPIEGTDLSFAVNTNWDVFFDSLEKTWYLLDGNIWLNTPDVLKEPWSLADKLPSDFSRLPDDKNWESVRARLSSGKTGVGDVPEVFVSTRPAELILLEGEAKRARIEGTDLYRITHTDSDLFYYAGDKHYYVLLSGRWFKSPNLERDWAPVGKDLPSDFAKIPSDGPKSHVLASVPGTPEAREAVLQAQIPRKAVLNKSEAKLNVWYNGEPELRTIPGTSLAYAVNTQSVVIRVGKKYYACQDGAWFVADSPTGPWKLADSVPAAIYTIPPSSPVYNATYVRVYDSTPEVVEYGYTAGYLGCYIEDGAMVYGTGYYYPPYLWPGRHPIFWPRPYSYGFRAYYNPYTGAFARGGVVYGPYRGLGRGAVYNPSTGAYARGTVAWGPHGGVAAGIVYTPAAGWHAGVHHFSPYARWGKAVIAGAAGATAATGLAKLRAPEGRAAAIRGTDRASAGERLSAAREQGKLQPGKDRAVGSTLGREHSAGVAGKGSGDLYVGKDGNIYRREGESWSKYSAGNRWEPVAKAQERTRGEIESSRGTGRKVSGSHESLERAEAEQMKLKERKTGGGKIDRGRSSSTSVERPSSRQHIDRRSQNVVSSLNREAVARARGQQKAASYRAYQRSVGSVMPRGGAFHRGGGRRR